MTATIEKSQSAYFKLQGSQGFTYYSTGTNLTLGKDGKARLPLKCSRKHARIIFREGQWILECLSKNGCYLDGGPLHQGEVKLLKSKALMQIGENIIYFLLPKNVPTGMCQVTTERLRQPFSRAERDQFRKSVLRWGIMRLAKLKADSPKRTLAEMNYYRKAFLSLVIFYSGEGKWSEMLKDMMKQISADRESGDIKISSFDKNLNSWLTLARHSSTFAGKLMLLERMRRCVNKFEAECLDLKIELKEKAHKPAAWWINGVHDKDLLQGIHELGYGEWQKIKKDLSLSFHKINPELKWPKTNALVARLNKIVTWIENKDLTRGVNEVSNAAVKKEENQSKKRPAVGSIPAAKRMKIETETFPDIAKEKVDVAEKVDNASVDQTAHQSPSAVVQSTKAKEPQSTTSIKPNMPGIS